MIVKGPHTPATQWAATHCAKSDHHHRKCERFGAWNCRYRRLQRPGCRRDPRTRRQYGTGLCCWGQPLLTNSAQARPTKEVITKASHQQAGYTSNCAINFYRNQVPDESACASADARITSIRFLFLPPLRPEQTDLHEPGCTQTCNSPRLDWFPMFRAGRQRLHRQQLRRDSTCH